MHKLYTTAYRKILTHFNVKQIEANTLNRLLTDRKINSVDSFVYQLLPKDQLHKFVKVPCPVQNPTKDIKIVNVAKTMRANFNIDEKLVCLNCPFKDQCPKKDIVSEKSDNAIYDLLLYSTYMQKHPNPSVLKQKVWGNGYRFVNNLILLLKDLQIDKSELQQFKHHWSAYLNKLDLTQQPKKKKKQKRIRPQSEKQEYIEDRNNPKQQTRRSQYMDRILMEQHQYKNDKKDKPYQKQYQRQGRNNTQWQDRKNTQWTDKRSNQWDDRRNNQRDDGRNNQRRDYSQQRTSAPQYQRNSKPQGYRIISRQYQKPEDFRERGRTQSRQGGYQKRDSYNRDYRPNNPRQSEYGGQSFSRNNDYKRKQQYPKRDQPKTYEKANTLNTQQDDNDYYNPKIRNFSKSKNQYKDKYTNENQGNVKQKRENPYKVKWTPEEDGNEQVLSHSSINKKVYNKQDAQQQTNFNQKNQQTSGSRRGRNVRR